MNLTNIMIRDIVNSYISLGKSVMGHVEINREIMDESTRRLYYANLKKDLAEAIQCNNNIETRLQIYNSSVSDNVDTMNSMFKDRITCRTKYESIIQCLLFMSGRINVEAFESNMNKLASTEVLEHVIETENRIMEA